VNGRSQSEVNSTVSKALLGVQLAGFKETSTGPCALNSCSLYTKPNQ
jgi:hypothetical protein